MTTDAEEEKAEEVHCHDCGIIASSPTEEAVANGFCHVKVFDARRRVVVVGHVEDQQQEQATAEILKDGYYWLCPDCFHYMRKTLLVVVNGGDLSDNFLTDADKT
jgi:hypothetical protein